MPSQCRTPGQCRTRPLRRASISILEALSELSRRRLTHLNECALASGHLDDGIRWHGL